MCEHCDWVSQVERIDGLINDDAHIYAWAFDTLNGIKETIERIHHVTPNQLRAIDNIENARKR